MPALIKYKGYKEGQVRRLASEWEDYSGTSVEDDRHAVRLSGRVLAGVQVPVPRGGDMAVDVGTVKEVVTGSRYMRAMQSRSGVIG